MLSAEQTGTIAVIAQGVEVVMFLDLVAYLLRLNIHKVSTLKKMQCKLYEDESFSKLNSKSFKLVLVACFKEQGQVIGQAMCQALHEISVKHNINNFEYHLKLAKTSEFAWAEETLKKCVPAKAKKVFIVGRHKTEEVFKEILRKIGIKERQIYFI